ncbi:MAG: IS110 family transposase [Candidatus Binatia bacterium]
MAVTRTGLDIAKNVFQVHGVDTHGKVVVRKQLSRGKVLPFFAQLPICRIGMEACGSAHYWGRELQKLGHDVRLMAVQLIKPYRTKQKNDRNAAEAICEAVSRPQMRFVPIQTVEQQAGLTVHRARELLVSERTAVANQIRGLLMEYGIIIAQGIQRLRRELPTVLSAEDDSLPALARSVVTELQGRLLELGEWIMGHDRQIVQVARQQEAAQRLMKVEGVGPITATALVATVGDATAFHHGRQFTAWLGLVPKQFSTGGKPVRGRITKRGNVSLRTLLIHGARAVLQHTGNRTDAKRVWVEEVRQRRGDNIAAVALAAKPARIVWALLARGQDYRLAA